MNSPPILEPILVVGLGCSLDLGTGFDPKPTGNEERVLRGKSYTPLDVLMPLFQVASPSLFLACFLVFSFLVLFIYTAVCKKQSF